MTPDPFDERVMIAVAAAAREPPDQREIHLRRICGADEELFREISEQLKWQEKMGGFLLQPLATLGAFDRPFAPGQTVSGRFQIVRELGEGGMGIVFEAFDLKRNSRIAVKVAKAGFKRLLTPELAGALKVRHPNICLVNEIHTAPFGEGEVDFLTMELLEGETLRERLSRDGSIPSAAALELARQLCAGLGEAHRSGVLHRDLKCGNVILTQTAEGKSRAVITDFGLSGAVSTGTAGFAGTPPYVAPELWEGRPASKASDVYALGVILYETLTGRQPFEADTASPPVAPGRLIKGLDPRWDAAILPCLLANPELRPTEPGKIIAVLEKRVPSKVWYAAAGMVIAAGLIPAIRDPILQRFRPPHIRLTVLPFDGPPETSAQIGGTLQDVTDRLRLRRSDRNPVVFMPPAEAAANEVKNAADAGRILHATHALEGRVFRDGMDLVVEASVVDIKAQTQLSHFSERYSPMHFGDIPKALAGSVSLALRLQGSAPPEKLSPAATAPYSRALFFLRRDPRSFDEAIPLLLEATQADPHSPLPLAGLTEAWLQKYQETKEQSSLGEAQRAYKSAETLDPDSVPVRLVGGMLNEASGKYEQALEDYARVIEIDPRNTEAFEGSADVYDAINMPDKAIAAYRKAIQTEPDYYAPYEALGVYYYYRGKYLEAAGQFQNAIDRAPGLVNAYTNLAAALDDLGRDADAERALVASLKLKTTAGALNSMGAIRTYQARHAEATSFYERAQQLDSRNYIILMNLGDSYRRTGQLSNAAFTYRRAMASATAALEDNPKRGYIRAFVGYLAARLGDRGRARNEIRQALQFSPADQQVIRQSVLAWEVLGDRERALDTLRNATGEMLNELGRQPDLTSLQGDPRFVKLKQFRQGPGAQPITEQEKR